VVDAIEGFEEGNFRTRDGTGGGPLNTPPKYTSETIAGTPYTTVSTLEANASTRECRHIEVARLEVPTKTLKSETIAGTPYATVSTLEANASTREDRHIEVARLEVPTKTL